MDNVKITGEQVEFFKKFKLSRKYKNEAIQEEKGDRRVLDASFPDLEQKHNEKCFMFGGKPVALWTKGHRTFLNQSKLELEYPLAFKACYLEGEVWTLDVLV